MSYWFSGFRSGSVFLIIKAAEGLDFRDVNMLIQYVCVNIFSLYDRTERLTRKGDL